ncbi:MAG: DUF4405 domain-containing protein [Candidatus Nanoarchaeia archaeon]|nr:DUF4405 domain-containing protein [Candidatus Nanoarchaeia archaeon]
MNKLKLNYWIDVGLAITFILTFITGIIKWPSFYQLVSTWPLKQITFIHDWSGLVMSILIFIHLILHWNWIVVVTKSTFKGKK